MRSSAGILRDPRRKLLETTAYALISGRAGTKQAPVRYFLASIGGRKAGLSFAGRAFLFSGLPRERRRWPEGTTEPARTAIEQRERPADPVSSRESERKDLCEDGRDPPALRRRTFFENDNNINSADHIFIVFPNLLRFFACCTHIQAKMTP